MSILIKGMEMPKNCGECPFTDSIWCGRTGQRIYSTMLDRLPDCPLIEVPKHGRLIDADALTNAIEDITWYHQNKNKDIVEGANSSEEQAWYREQDIYAAVDAAPTIIEAEPDCTTCPVKGKACKVFYRDKGDDSVCKELREAEGEDG